MSITRRQFATAIGVLGAGFVVGCTPGASGTAGSGSTAAGSGAGAAGSSPTDPRDAGIVRSSTFAFDTLVDIGVYGDQSAIDSAFALCERYDGLLSAQREGSDVWRINHAAGAPVEVAPETADVISKSLEFCRLSEGAFDITIGTVSLLWDFNEGVRPSDEAIAQALPHIDWRGVSVSGTTVQLADPAQMIDLGGIAKGWIADSLADHLRQQGIESAIINLGGNVFALGEKPSGAPWLVGLRDPNVSAGKAVATIEVRNASVVTSGLYERHFELDGVDYYHILDHRTGYPAQTDVRADTVVTPLSLTGDGLSTTLFILGSERGRAFAESQPNVEALFTLEGGGTVQTSGFSQYNYQLLDQ